MNLKATSDIIDANYISVLFIQNGEEIIDDVVDGEGSSESFG